jgi:hypothetical protein
LIERKQNLLGITSTLVISVYRCASRCVPIKVCGTQKIQTTDTEVKLQACFVGVPTNSSVLRDKQLDNENGSFKLQDLEMMMMMEI